jgi:hypothetical protein
MSKSSTIGNWGRGWTNKEVVIMKNIKPSFTKYDKYNAENFTLQFQC